MASNSVLVNEIYDHFLVCTVCSEGFKCPKTLSCQHTFCKDCLVKHHEAEQERPHGYRFLSRSVSCPVCRKRTDLPIGGVLKLSDNFLVSNLYDVVEKRRRYPSKPDSVCDICRPTTMTTGGRTRSGNDNHAYYRCLDCSKMLCRRCADLHRRTKVTQDHGLFDVGVREKDVQCRVHRQETIRFFCEPCEECICVLCTFQDHKDHEVFTFTEGLERHSRSFDELLECGRFRCTRMREQIELIDRCESNIKAMEEQVRETAMEWVRHIRQQEREILRQLKELSNSRTREFLQQKTPLQETLSELENTCSLTEVVIRDRSVELLMLKNEINKKLNRFLTEDRTVHSPDVLIRSVVFRPGSCFLGELDFDGEDLGMFTRAEPHVTKTKRTEHGSRSLELARDRIFDEFVGQTKEFYDQETNFDTEQKERIERINTHESVLRQASSISRPETTTQNGKLIERYQSRFETGAAKLRSNCGCRCLNKRKSFVCVDRSTMTTEMPDIRRDKVLDTAGLICTKDGSTQSGTPSVKSVEAATDPIFKENRSTSTTKPDYLDKCGMTEHTKSLSIAINTIPTAMQDEVTMTEPVAVCETATLTDPVTTANQSTCTGNSDPESVERIITTKAKHYNNTTTTKKYKCPPIPSDKETSGGGVLRRQTRVSLSRGTSTESIHKIETGTATDSRSSTFMDRASSPIRFSGVDKAVSASRGEIVAPVDTFQAAGKHRKLLRPSGPKLDAICEGSDEVPTADDEFSSCGPLPVRQRFTTSRGGSSWDHQKGGLLTHREKFAPAFGAKLRGPPTSSTFSVEGRRSASSIVWKVETGTNTFGVELQDKSVGTDTLALDIKMAECINKLKTVRRRLETKQTTSGLTSGSKESPDMTTSTSSVESNTTERRHSSTPISPKQHRKQMVLSLNQAPSSPRKQHRPFSRQDSSQSESSDQDQLSPLTGAPQRTSPRRPQALARKQRTAVGDMLRLVPSSAAAKTRSPRIIRKQLQENSSVQNT